MMTMTLRDARIQAHDAILAVSALGRTLLPAQPDDSHQSFMWSDEHEAFVQEAIDGRLRPGLRLRDLTLLLIEEKVHELPLRAPHDVRMLARMYCTAAQILGHRLERRVAVAAPVDRKLLRPPAGGACEHQRVVLPVKTFEKD